MTFGTGEERADAEGRIVTVEYDAFAVVGVYVPNSGQKLEKLDYRTTVWNPHFARYVTDLESASGKAVVVAGDLNVAHRNPDV